MGRTNGATNKEQREPAVLSLSDSERIELLANIIFEIIIEEEAGFPSTEELCKAS